MSSATDSLLSLVDAPKLFAGTPSYPDALRITKWTSAFVILFQLFIIFLNLAALNVGGFLRAFKMSDVPAEVRRIVIKDCHVQFLACDISPRVQRRFTDALFTPTNVDGEVLTIDGTKTLRCAVDVCLHPEWLNNNGSAVNDTATREVALVAGSVLDMTNLAGTMHHPLSIQTQRGGEDSIAKVLFGSQAVFTETVHVNLAKGFVMASDLPAAAGVNFTVTYGAVVLAASFDDVSPGFSVDATIADNNLCVSSNVTTIQWDAACFNGTATTTAAFNASAGVNASSSTPQPTEVFCPVQVSVAATGNTTLPTPSITVRASALYVDTATSFVTGRLIGPGITADPSLDFNSRKLLGETLPWIAGQTFGDFVQVLDLASPSIGVLFQHTNRRIMLEIGPEWLGFYSATALLPSYRRVSSVLSHYGCPATPLSTASHPRVAIGVTGVITQDSSALSKPSLRKLLERTISLESIEVVVQQITRVSGVLGGLVAFSTPDTEWQDSRWNVYTVERGDDGPRRQPLAVSGIATAVQVIAVCTCVFGAAFIFWTTLRYRTEILAALMQTGVRGQQRKLAGYTEPVPYHFFFSLLHLASWIKFNVTKVIAEYFAGIFGEMLYYSLKLYYQPLETAECYEDQQKLAGKQAAAVKSNDTAAQRTIAREIQRLEANKRFQSLPLAVILSHYEKWQTLRYASDVQRMSRESALAKVASFGSRARLEDEKVVRGVRARLEVPAEARFEMTLSSFQLFFDLTPDDLSNEVEFNTIYFLAFKQDETVESQRLLKLLTAWKLKVVTRTDYVVTNIRSKDETKIIALDGPKMYELVEALEFNAAVFPSYGETRFLTYGEMSGKAQYVFRTLWLVYETLWTIVIVIAPFFLVILIVLSLDVMHSRYGLARSSLTVYETHVTFTTEPGEQSFLFTLMVYVTWVFVIAAALEAPLVIAAFRRYYRRVRFNEPRNPVRYVFTGMRWIVTFVTLLLTFFALFFLVAYALLVATWWTLGAIIAPDRMLVYAASVFTFLYVCYTTYNNLSQLQKLALRRLEERIVSELLKFVRKTPLPAGTAAVIERRLAQDSGDGGGGNGAVGTSLLLDLATGSKSVVETALTEAAHALGVPDVVVLVLAGFASRKPEKVNEAAEEIARKAGVDEQFVPVLEELVHAVMGLRTNPQKLVRGLVAVKESETGRTYRGPYEPDYTPIFEEVAAMLVDEDVEAIRVVLFGVSLALKDTLGHDHEAFVDIYWLLEAVALEDREETLTWVSRVVQRIANKVVKDPTLDNYMKLITESLNLAAGGEHSVRQAAANIFRDWEVRDSTGFISAILPALVPKEQRKSKRQVAAERRKAQAEGDVAKDEEEDDQDSAAARLKNACGNAARLLGNLAISTATLMPHRTAVLKLLHGAVVGHLPDGVQIIGGVPRRKMYRTYRRALLHFDKAMIALHHQQKCFNEFLEMVAGLDAIEIDYTRFEDMSEMFEFYADRSHLLGKDGATHVEKLRKFISETRAKLDDCEDELLNEPVIPLARWISQQWFVLVQLSLLPAVPFDYNFTVDADFAESVQLPVRLLTILKETAGVALNFIGDAVGRENLVDFAQHRDTACNAANDILMRMFPEMNVSGDNENVIRLRSDLKDRLPVVAQALATKRLAPPLEASSSADEKKGSLGAGVTDQKRVETSSRGQFFAFMASGDTTAFARDVEQKLAQEEQTSWTSQVPLAAMDVLRLRLQGSDHADCRVPVQRLLRLIEPRDLYGDDFYERAYQRKRGDQIKATDARFAGLRDDLAEFFATGKLSDFGTVSELVDVSTDIIDDHVNPANACAMNRVLAPLSIFALALQGELDVATIKDRPEHFQAMEAYSTLFAAGSGRTPTKLVENVTKVVVELARDTAPPPAGGDSRAAEGKTPPPKANSDDREPARDTEDASVMAFIDTVKAKAGDTAVSRATRAFLERTRCRDEGRELDALRSAAYLHSCRRLQALTMSPTAMPASRWVRTTADDEASSHDDETADQADSAQFGDEASEEADDFETLDFDAINEAQSFLAHPHAAIACAAVDFNVDEITEAVQHAGQIFAVWALLFAKMVKLLREPPELSGNTPPPPNDDGGDSAAIESSSSLRSLRSTAYLSPKDEWKAKVRCLQGDIKAVCDELYMLIGTVAPALYRKCARLYAWDNFTQAFTTFTQVHELPYDFVFLRALCDICFESAFVRGELDRSPFVRNLAAELSKDRKCPEEPTTALWTYVKSLETNAKEGSDEVTWVTPERVVEACSAALNPDTAFTDLSPFALCSFDSDSAELRKPLRHRFALLAGIPLWYNPDRPRPECALITTYVQHGRTPPAVLSVISDLVPLKFQTAAKELLSIAAGRKIKAKSAGEARLRRLLFPEDVRDGDLLHKFISAEDACRHEPCPVPWLSLVKAISQGNPFALIPYSEPGIFSYKEKPLNVPLCHRAVYWFAKASVGSEVAHRLLDVASGRGPAQEELRQLGTIHNIWKQRAVPSLAGDLGALFEFVTSVVLTDRDDRLAASPSLLLLVSLLHFARRDFDQMLLATEALWRLEELRIKSTQPGWDAALTHEKIVATMRDKTNHPASLLIAATRLGVLAARLVVDEGNVADYDLAVLVVEALTNELEVQLSKESSRMRKALKSKNMLTFKPTPADGGEDFVWDPESFDYRFIKRLLPAVRELLPPHVMSEECCRTQDHVLNNMVAAFLMGDEDVDEQKKWAARGDMGNNDGAGEQKQQTTPDASSEATGADDEGDRTRGKNSPNDAPRTSEGDALAFDFADGAMITLAALVGAENDARRLLLENESLKKFVPPFVKRVLDVFKKDDPIASIGLLIDALVLLTDLSLLPPPDTPNVDEQQQELLKQTLMIIQTHFKKFEEDVKDLPRDDRSKFLRPGISAVLEALVSLHKARVQLAVSTSLSDPAGAAAASDSASQPGTLTVSNSMGIAAGGGKGEKSRKLFQLLTALIALSEGELTAVADLAAILQIEMNRDQLAQLQQLYNTLRAAQGMERQKGTSSAPSAAEGMDMFEIVSTQIFRELDSEKRGRITFEDFVIALDQMHISLSSVEKLDLFKSAVQTRNPQAMARSRANAGLGGGGARSAEPRFQIDGGADRGYLTLPEFQHALRDIRQAFVERMLIRLRLTDTTILLSVIWLGIVLLLLLTFFILGVIAFTDGTSFTAVISAGIPMIGALVSAAQDPAKVQLLLSNVDTAAESFFRLLANDFGPAGG